MFQAAVGLGNRGTGGHTLKVKGKSGDRVWWVAVDRCLNCQEKGARGSTSQLPLINVSVTKALI